MTYGVNKLILSQVESEPARQTISTTYTEITGSRCKIFPVGNSDILYKFIFYLSTIYDFNGGGAYDKPFLHVKLQKSNDNFSSNIVDVEGCNFNASGDTQENNDYHYSTYSPTFILENLDSNHLRLVARSYSTSNKAHLHRSYIYDGSNSNEVYFNTTLLVIET
jgi:hypothetical protein